jgi:hypothetical protein
MMWVLYLLLFFGLIAARRFLPRLALMLAFPKLRGERYEITSNPDSRYNCIGWAAGDATRWWDSSPDGYWPPTANKGRRIADLIEAFQAVGFILSLNGSFENGRQKVVLYEDSNGNWTHAAKRLNANWWSSKLGKNYDISHKDPDDIGGGIYGQATTYMIK